MRFKETNFIWDWSTGLLRMKVSHLYRQENGTCRLIYCDDYLLLCLWAWVPTAFSLLFKTKAPARAKNPWA
jgi:hypothetical protein